MLLFPGRSGKSRDKSNLKGKKKRINSQVGAFGGVNMNEFKNMDYDNISNYGDNNLQLPGAQEQGMTRNLSMKSVNSNKTNKTSKTSKTNKTTKTISNTMNNINLLGPSANMMGQFSKSQHIS